MGEPLSNDNKGCPLSPVSCRGMEKLRTRQRHQDTQNNSTNAWMYNSSANNNNKANSNRVLPVFAYSIDNDNPRVTYFFISNQENKKR